MNPGTSNPMASMYGISPIFIHHLKTTIHVGKYTSSSHGSVMGIFGFLLAPKLPTKKTSHKIVHFPISMVEILQVGHPLKDRVFHVNHPFWGTTYGWNSPSCPGDRSQLRRRRSGPPCGHATTQRHAGHAHHEAVAFVGDGRVVAWPGFVGWKGLDRVERDEHFVENGLMFSFQILHKVETQFCNVFFLEMMYWHM